MWGNLGISLLGFGGALVVLRPLGPDAPAMGLTPAILALVLGTAGLPHILVRFFTVPTAQDARKSVVVAMGLIGAFYVMTAFMGNAANVLVGKDVTIELDLQLSLQA